MARVDVTPIIPNTTMQKYVDDNNVERVYYITPISGYVLHDKGFDYPEMDTETGEETWYEGFRRTTASVSINYDFVANPREFYTVPETEVPENQIFGGGNNDNEHEII